jgi:hypothetical protein
MTAPNDNPVPTWARVVAIAAIIVLALFLLALIVPLAVKLVIAVWSF